MRIVEHEGMDHSFQGPTRDRYVIVNADDFGQSRGINRGIIQAYEQGVVTSTSLMVRWPGAVEAAAYGRAHQDFSLGLHVDLGEWAYRCGSWVILYQVVAEANVAAITAELCSQLAEFRRLVGRDPTHLDSHQHVHREEPLRSVLCDLATKLGVPLRTCTSQVRYCGDFYGQTGRGLPCPEAISVNGLIGILTSLTPGVTELGCHPGLENDLDSMYRSERAVEVNTLCDPRVRSAIIAERIELCSFATSAGRAELPRPRGDR